MPPMPMSSSLLFDLQQSRSHLRSVLRYTAPLPVAAIMLTHTATDMHSCTTKQRRRPASSSLHGDIKTTQAAAVQIHPTKDPTQALGPVAPEIPIPSRTRVSPPLKQVQRLPARADVTV
ncbi:hypothetical protein SNOG_13623 [Parastagonospora nodorum SN15]|uniref:Uncharacterized protein n=1 Tax=Phaeosphaeria nodorum (strain SN15 / ATCC MYA-4574 / FGSC 10173) TaxID=321614 RepID=Q0U3P1_PHANO|nr:hypothetical protein SNOG_13623 [Parastagonospora nodorum SN15]EAT79070.1 hypothetical protein SNOG_13623 [Parastagonospora nodorum SN15]